MQSLREIFTSLDRVADKWEPYFEVYEQFFSRFRGKSPKVLEVGVFLGGGLEMWSKYFGPGSEILGIDIEPSTLDKAPRGTRVFIGDQGDSGFWNDFLLSQPGPYDIIIDDGGHRMEQQILTLQKTLPLLKEGGVYLCEDTHTSYWPRHGGGLKSSSSFIEYSKQIIDVLHDAHTVTDDLGNQQHGERLPRELVAMYGCIRAVHYFDSMVILEKGAKQPFRRIVSRS